MKITAWVRFLVPFVCVLLLAACHEEKESNSLTDNADDFEDLRPFSTSATYSAVITECVKAESASQLCTLGTLPLLGQQVNNPTVEDIMDRLVISHDWMANRFQQILEQLPPEVLPLFKGLTAIVIDDDIRPAFYTTSTGAIYLDPAYLWVTVEEKRTINIKDDYRSGFADALAIRALGFYTHGNNYAFSFGSLTNDQPRAFEDALHLLARLLLHELAHVNDFIPPDSYASLNSNMTVTNAAASLVAQRPSNALAIDYSLTSQMHIDLAQVMYFGATATTQQQQIGADEAGAEFEADGASDHYGYSNQFEDAAMLFENALMKQFFDFDYDVFFIDVNPDATVFCDNLVGWGMFNRVGDSEVKARAQYIIGELLPNLNTSLFFQDLAAPVAMTAGESWCENLAAKPSDNDTNAQKPSRPIPRDVPKELLRKPYI